MGKFVWVARVLKALSGRWQCSRSSVELNHNQPNLKNLTEPNRTWDKPRGLPEFPFPSSVIKAQRGWRSYEIASVSRVVKGDWYSYEIARVGVEWRFSFTPVHTSTRYRLLAIQCRWRFLATWWSGYPYLSHTCGVPDYDVVIDTWP